METEESDVCTQPASSIGCSSNSTKGPQDDATSDTGKNEENTEKFSSDTNIVEETQHTRESASNTSGNQTRQKSQSPEPGCSICLGKVENKSFTDSCFHTFCFVCLVEWSKVKAVCPLCKQPFKSIIHNVRSNEDYDQLYLEHRDQATERSASNRSDERFRYRTTVTREAWIERQLQMQQRQLELLQRPSLTTTRSMWTRHRQASTSAFRKRIYTMGMRVSEVKTACGRPLRQREVSPAFFSRNPACIHRLVPWLNRELNVLLHNHEDNVQFVLELIMDLLKRFDIQSEEFAEHLRSFLGQRTEHFIHEFYTFCRSPYDMVAYDGYAVYGIENNRHEPHEISSPSSSDDSVVAVDIIASPGNPRTAIDDNVIVLNSDDEEVTPGPSNSQQAPSALSSFMHDLPGSNLLNSVRQFLSSASRNSPPWGWESPSLTMDWQAPSTSHTVLPVTIDSVLDLSTPSASQQNSDNNAARSLINMPNGEQAQGSGPVVQSDSPINLNVDGTSPPLSVKIKRESETVSSYGSDLEIVGYEKPWDERSAIDVSSAAEAEKELLKQIRKKKVKESRKQRARSSSSSSSSDARKARKRKKKTRTRSRSRGRSRSDSTSYFQEYDRNRRRSRSRKKNRKTRSRQRDERSRSRSRHSRSRHRYSRQRRERSDSSRSSRQRSRRQRHSRSRSRGRNRPRSQSRSVHRTSRSHSRHRKTSRSCSRSYRRSRSCSRPRRSHRSRSRSKMKKSKKRTRSRSRTRRSYRRSRSVSVEYCALGKYDTQSKRKDRNRDVSERHHSSSYTSEWVHGKRATETGAHRRRRNRSSSSSNSSVVCISKRSSGEKRRRKTSDSIEVVYDSQRRSKKHRSDREQEKPGRRRSVSEESRSRDRSKHKSRDKESERKGEQASCKKHPTGHKGRSKTSVNREESRHSSSK